MGIHCSKACGRKYKVIKAHKLNVITQEQESKPAGSLLCLLGMPDSYKERQENKREKEKKQNNQLGLSYSERYKINLSVKGNDHGV